MGIDNKEGMAFKRTEKARSSAECKGRGRELLSIWGWERVTRINRNKDVRTKDVAEVTQGGCHRGDMATEKLADERRPTGSDFGATWVRKEC